MSDQSKNPTATPERDCGCGEAPREPASPGIFEWLRPTRRTVSRTLGALAAMAAPGALFGAEVRKSCGPPKAANPGHASAAEGMPPLPLPVTPQRRTEKKNPPKPPVIAVKIKTGDRHDWATDPNDMNNLLDWMKAKLGVNFTYEEKPLNKVNLESGDVPVLYRTGHNAFSFSAGERQRLRRYLLNGGMMIFDACCGRPAFAESARREIKKILPDYKLKRIGLDHPLLNCYYQNAGMVRFTDWTFNSYPDLKSPGPCQVEGVEVECRMAVVFSPHDLSCGWDMHTHKLEGTTSYIKSEDALKIGANYMAYATATLNQSVSLTDAKKYKNPSPTKTDKFRVGQIVHPGDWNPDPAGLRNLLDVAGSETALQVNFDTTGVQPTGEDLSRFPFVYMTGHEDFTWDKAQVAAIRRYLANGGFLFADACCGRQAFDHAFRREMAKVLQANPKTGGFRTLSPDHPIYSIHHNVDRVKLTEAADYRAKGKASNVPKLEGAAIDGRLAAVYSPLALNVGWRVKPVPYAVGYAPESALKLGVNTVMYAMTH